MHMRFSEEELATLSEMLSLACWCSSWNRKPGSDEGVNRYESMLQRVLQRTQYNGLGDMVEVDIDTNKLRLAKDYEEKAFCTESYDEMRMESFWEELMILMADRDMVKTMGQKTWEAIPAPERRKLATKREHFYREVFQKRGMQDLHHIAQGSQ